MGGREVGGLCAGLPGYRTVTNEKHRSEIEDAWGLSPGSISPEPGLPATEMFRSLDDGDIRLMWVVATNPATSMPDLARTKRALEKAPFLVVSDAYPTETTKYANLILPAAGWGEKEGTMTNSERRVSLVEKVVEPPGEARADCEVFADVGRRLGFGEAFGWRGASEVFDEERIRLVPRARFGLREKDEHPGTSRLYANGKFNTPDGRARFLPTPHEGLAEEPSDEYPLTLSTGRVKNQWHTMTRTGLSERLMRGLEDGPFVEVHPETAGRFGVCNGEMARVSSERGSFVSKVEITEDIELGTIFAPFHWGDLWTEGGSVNEATHDASDPVSKEPELKGASVRAEPVGVEGRGSGDRVASLRESGAAPLRIPLRGASEVGSREK